MLTTNEHLNQTQEALACLERALASIHRDRAKMHPEWYRIMAAPVAEDIRKLRRQIDDFIGMDDPQLADQQSEQSNGVANGAVAPPVVHS